MNTIIAHLRAINHSGNRSTTTIAHLRAPPTPSQRRCTSALEHNTNEPVSPSHQHTRAPERNPKELALPPLTAPTVAPSPCATNTGLLHHRRSHNWGTNGHQQKP
ncbi:hypothetical protein VNO80_01608 [Phaseolus coccineus]|uniref:Uncharacterized protein n=1 Tax=Phaseolus coccineus TaxID=3886 RepID=A0AAN9WX11_PHACN